MISAVMLTLNDAERLTATLASLAPAAMDGLVAEVILADAGSSDETLATAEDAGARVLAVSGEAALAAACAAARQPWLLILKPGTRLQTGWEASALDHIRKAPQAAGWFRLALAAPGPAARMAEAGASLRGRLLGRPSAEQGLLISSRLYVEAGVAGASHDRLVRALGAPRLRPLAARALTGAP